MRSPRGFGKNYFTLSAIQAYASAKRLEQNANRIRIHRENRLQISEEASELDDPPTELLNPIEPLPSQGGLCNCKFARLAHLCLRRNRKPKKLLLSPIHTYSTISPPSFLPYFSHYNHPTRNLMNKYSFAASALLVSSLCATEYTLEPIVVSASKTEQSLKSIPASVEVITSDDIAEKHFTTVTEALNSLPGISYTANGGLGSSQEVFIRGMDGKRILVLIDGIRYNDPSNTSGADLSHLMIGDIERIEVIKGAQSGIWGADASAGVINIITKPVAEGNHAGANIEAGSFGTRKWGGFVSHRTSLYDLKASAERIISDSFSVQAPYGTDIDLYENDPYSNTSFNLAGHLRPTSTDTIGFIHTDIRALSNYDGWNAPDSLQRSKIRTQLSGFTYNKRLESHSIDFKANLSTFKRDELDTTWGVKVFNGKTQEMELRDKISYNEDDFAVIGISKQRNDVDFIRADSSTGENRIDAKALFATNSNRFGDLILAESIRWDDYSNFDNKTTGKIGAKYFLIPELYVKGNFGTAYTAPSQIQMLNPWGTPNAYLKPENTKSFDVGIGNERFSLTYFDNKVKELIDWNAGQYQNLSGTSSFQGFEAALKQTFPENFVLGLNYTYLTKCENDRGEELRRRPKEEFKASLDYYGIDRLHLGFNADYVGTRYDQNNQTGRQTGRYTLLGVVANYSLGDTVQIFAKVDNLTNKYYQVVDGYATSPRAWYAGLQASF